MNPEIDRMEWLAEGIGRYWHYALGGLAIICLMSGNYAPLMERATERYLESEGKALWQLQERAETARGALRQVVAEAEQAVREAAERRRQREEAARRALEEQQRAEAERLRLAQSQAEEHQRQAQLQADYQQSYTRNLAEFEAIAQRYFTGLVMTLADVVQFESALSKQVQTPGFLDDKPFTMGEISTPTACSNPASFDKLFNLDGVRDHNLRACMIYYASNDRHARSNLLHRHATTALFLRMKWTGEQYHTLPDIFALHWYMAIVNATNQGNYVPSPLSLFSGDELSNSIFAGVDSGFTALVANKATNREILLLRDTVHPDMVRLASLAQQIATACQRLGMTRCIDPIISF